MDIEIQVLLVEDDPRDLRLMVRQLQNQNWNCRIQVARDGEEALDIVFRRGIHANAPAPDRPHVVLLDLKLPKVDGLEVFREIKSRPETRMIPVIALTSSGEEKDRIDCYNLGVNGYVQKPVDFEQFRSTIKAMGLYWLAINLPPPDKMFARSGDETPHDRKG
ncbi:MAG: response regulator [Bryobacteraceae bacterium]